jgi:hypothetical protein
MQESRQGSRPSVVNSTLYINAVSSPQLQNLTKDHKRKKIPHLQVCPDTFQCDAISSTVLSWAKLEKRRFYDCQYSFSVEKERWCQARRPAVQQGKRPSVSFYLDELSG